MTVIVGMIATTDGAAIKRTVELSPSGRGAIEHRDYHSSPAIEFRSNQPSVIPVDVDHTDRIVGQVRYLAQRGHGLFGVLEVDDDVAAGLPDRFHLSPDFEGRRRHDVFSDIELSSVALVERTAVVAQQPATIVHGDLADAHLYWANDHRQLLKEAAAYDAERRYRPSQPHRIAGARVVEEVRGNTFVDGQPVAQRRSTGRTVTLPGGSRAPLEYSAHRGRVISVR